MSAVRPDSHVRLVRCQHQRCDALNPADARFCGRCGRPLPPGPAKPNVALAVLCGVGLTMLLPVLLAMVISGHMLCMLVGLLLVGAVGYALVRSLRKSR
jgi:hypothetical protein